MTMFYFLIVIMIVVFIHELGHYLVGRWSGIHAEVFSIGFGPQIYKRTDKHGTLWQVALLPLGGYVRFANDKNGTSFPSLDSEKPPYQASFFGKFMTIFAGPLFNFVLSIALFAASLLIFGQQSSAPTIGEVTKTGFEIEAGDTVLAINDQPVADFGDILVVMDSDEPEFTATIERSGQTQTISIPNIGLPIIDGLEEGGPAALGGLMAGDQITGIAGVSVNTSRALVETLQDYSSGMVDVEFLRNGELNTAQVLPKRVDVLSETGEVVQVVRIGIMTQPVFWPGKEPVGIVDALGSGVRQTYMVLALSIDGIKQLVTGDVGVEALSGPIGIARMSDDAASQGIQTFMIWIGLISSSIGFLNLLPLPILDGGHLILLSYERIFGRLPPKQVLNVAFSIGFIFLITLMLVASFNDIFRPLA